MKKNILYSISALALGIAVGTGIFLKYGDNFLLTHNAVDTKIYNPSYYAKEYLKVISNDDLYNHGDKQSNFFIFSNENIGLKENSNAVTQIKILVDSYVNEFLFGYDTNKPIDKHIDVAKKFYIEKTPETYKNILVDMKENEILFRIKPSDIKVDCTLGGLEASLDSIVVVFKIEFTVAEKIEQLNPDKLFKFEIGKQYSQTREAVFKRTKDGTYKIEDISINEIEIK